MSTETITPTAESVNVNVNWQDKYIDKLANDVDSIKADIRDLKNNFNADMKDLKTNVNADMKELRSSIQTTNQHIQMLFITMLVGIAALIINAMR